MARERVIVLGAGLAGLAAARALAATNYEVVVLEARDRVGGRVHTADGVDLGAHWIHSTEGNPLTNLARELGLATLFTGGDSTYTGGWEQIELRRDGVPISAEEKERSILFIDDLRDQLESVRRSRAEQDADDIPVAAALEEVLGTTDIPPDLRAHAAWHLTLMTREDWAGGADRLSLRWWDDGYEVYGYGDSIFVDGAGAVAEALAAGLDVRLEHEVHRVVRSPGGVRLDTSRGPFHADRVVVTLPLGVLKADRVTFDPPLPQAKRDAIGRLGMGNLAKVVLEYDAPFWPRQRYVFGTVTEDLGAIPTAVINLYKTHRRPILVLLAGGELGREIESWSTDRVTRWSQSIIARLFGDTSPSPTRVQVTQWSRDPWALGAYTYLAVGATPADLERLAEPVEDRLFFAGEATVRSHWACMHGAYLSGLREAARISGDTGLLPPRHFSENRRWRETLHRANRFLELRGRSVARDEVEARTKLLAASDVFGCVDPADLRILATMFSRIELPQGAVLCREGQPASSAFAIESGGLDVFRGGGPAPVAHMRPGETAGEYGLFLPSGRTATLVATEDTSVLVLEYVHFQRFLLAFPEALMSLLRVSLQRARAREQATRR